MLQNIWQYKGEIELITGLMIGGGDSNLHVGGVDNPIVKNPVTNLPYIPGSSLKGKIRSLLEHKYNKISSKGGPCGCGRRDCEICTLFGAHFNNKSNAGTPRLLFRDCSLTKESMDLVNSIISDNGNWLEIKMENMVPRTKGKTNPRTMERVPAGFKFDFNVSLQVFDDDDEKRLKEVFEEGLRLLQMSALGGSGSRGYGQVKITGEWIAYDLM